MCSILLRSFSRSHLCILYYCFFVQVLKEGSVTSTCSKPTQNDKPQPRTLASCCRSDTDGFLSDFWASLFLKRNISVMEGDPWIGQHYAFHMLPGTVTVHVQAGVKQFLIPCIPCIPCTISGYLCSWNEKLLVQMWIHLHTIDYVVSNLFFSIHHYLELS